MRYGTQSQHRCSWGASTHHKRRIIYENRIRIAEKSKLELSEEQKDLLVTVTTFNIQARYDDVKREFYHKCSKEFTEVWIDKIKGF